MPARAFANPSRSGSASSSTPGSGSKRSVGTTSWMAPRRAPATSTCDRASVSSGSAVSGELPEATSVTEVRKALASAAVRSASPPRSPASWAPSTSVGCVDIAQPFVVCRSACFAVDHSLPRGRRARRPNSPVRAIERAARLHTDAAPLPEPLESGLGRLMDRSFDRSSLDGDAPSIACSLDGMLFRWRARRLRALSVASSLDCRLGWWSGVDAAAALEGTAESHLVGVLEVAAHGQPRGEPRHRDTDVAQQAGEVRGRGLALEVRVGRDDDLLHLARREPGHELAHPQVVRPDAVDRADRPAEHVVGAAELPRALDGDDVLGLLDDTDGGLVAPGVSADATALGLRDVSADVAEAHLGPDLGQ